MQIKLKLKALEISKSSLEEENNDLIELIQEMDKEISKRQTELNNIHNSSTFHSIQQLESKIEELSNQNIQMMIENEKLKNQMLTCQFYKSKNEETSLFLSQIHSNLKEFGEKIEKSSFSYLFEQNTISNLNNLISSFSSFINFPLVSNLPQNISQKNNISTPSSLFIEKQPNNLKTTSLNSIPSPQKPSFSNLSSSDNKIAKHSNISKEQNIPPIDIPNNSPTSKSSTTPKSRITSRAFLLSSNSSNPVRMRFLK